MLQLVLSVSLVIYLFRVLGHARIKDLLTLELLAICQVLLLMLLRYWLPPMLPLVLGPLPLEPWPILMELCRFVSSCTLWPGQLTTTLKLLLSLTLWVSAPTQIQETRQLTQLQLEEDWLLLPILTHSFKLLPLSSSLWDASFVPILLFCCFRSIRILVALLVLAYKNIWSILVGLWREGSGTLIWILSCGFHICLSSISDFFKSKISDGIQDSISSPIF